MSHSGGPRRPLGMNIAIAGGTGTLGRQVAEELRACGHEARVLSRSAPEYQVDLTTGAGLDKALDGCEVVIDASNNSSPSAAATLVEGTRRLLAAGRDAGIAHHVTAIDVIRDPAKLTAVAEAFPDATFRSE
jgi:nucleoside-diphosphate-sugar epimerase